MKQLLSITFLLLTQSFAFSQVESKDYEQVYKAVNSYFRGWEAKDKALLSNIFHPESQLKFVSKDKKYQSVKIDQHIIDITKAEAGFLPAHEKTVSNIHIFQEGASAIVHLRFKTFEVTDYFQLLKIEEVWKIVNKVSVSKVLSEEISGK